MANEAESPWEIRLSKSRLTPYFFNKETKKSYWVAPDTLSEEEIKLLNEKYLKSTADDHPEQSGGGGPGQRGGGVPEACGPEQAGAGDQPTRVRATHLLVKHRGSRNPSSWKEKNITRTKDEAIAMLIEHRARIDRSEATLDELAKENSDCSSHSKGGDLGWFARKDMQASFADATFALQVGQMSDVVESDSGVHLIQRTG